MRILSRSLAVLTLFIYICSVAVGQTTTKALPQTIDAWADRVTRFGRAIPQEKVFVHMDNTCYFLGDTIWYAVYTRRTDRRQPSDVSGVLYMELLNQEGYLVERQMIEMSEGRGNGYFALPDTLYGGFYELRAYTRWQLNWGITEKAHTSYAEQWFYSKALAKEYYRDYEKLYSRVFPVYDKPERAGEFFHDMTTRPLRRYFKDAAEEPQPQLTLYPEGGILVAGVPCRMAFEAATESGEALSGRVALTDSRGVTVAEAATVSRGRGLLTLTPVAGESYKATFTADDGRSASQTTERVQADGVALSVQRQADDYLFDVKPQGAAAAKELGLTVMCEGIVVHSETIAAGTAPTTLRFTPAADADGQGTATCGVHQVTVFDADGRIWADRLFFVQPVGAQSPALTVTGLKADYQPFEHITLGITSAATSRAASTPISLSVRDLGTSDYTFDTSDILTEMLLSSELRGYIPDPAYFFEADDDEHRTALDLLMLTQGWRRFSWHTMATPGAFQLTQPAETQTPILRGEVLNYKTSMLQNDVEQYEMKPTPYQYEKIIDSLSAGNERDFKKSLRESDIGLTAFDVYEGMGQAEVIETISAKADAKERNFPAGSYRMTAPIAAARFNAKESPLDKEVRVHAEFTQPGSESIIGDVETRQGLFSIPTPRFYGNCVFFLAASDTTKWKSPRHTWIQMDETEYPEFYVRIAWPYPRFTQPYDHYQTAYRETPADAPQASQTSFFNPKTFETQMGGLTVRARRGGLRSFDAAHPALIVDAYRAYNEACDAGLATGWFGGRIHFINNIARTYVGDMNSTHSYLLEPRYDGRNTSFNRPPSVIDRFNQLTHIDSVLIYTDFKPRYGADPRATEDNIDRVTIDLRQMANEGQRVTYRDRRYILQGFAEPEAFYSPDYSRRPLPEGQADYRRTLYWNPNLMLDEQGHAQVSFYAGSKPATLAVEANGQTADGTLLTNGKAPAGN